jgi:hypothetical protein
MLRSRSDREYVDTSAIVNNRHRISGLLRRQEPIEVTFAGMSFDRPSCQYSRLILVMICLYVFQPFPLRDDHIQMSGRIRTQQHQLPCLQYGLMAQTTESSLPYLILPSPPYHLPCRRVLMARGRATHLLLAHRYLIGRPRSSITSIHVQRYWHREIRYNALVAPKIQLSFRSWPLRTFSKFFGFHWMEPTSIYGSIGVHLTTELV